MCNKNKAIRDQIIKDLQSGNTATYLSSLDYLEELNAKEQAAINSKKVITVNVDQLKKLVERHSEELANLLDSMMTEEIVGQYDLLLTEIIELDNEQQNESNQTDKKN